MRILILEDQLRFTSLLKAGLEANSYVVDVVDTIADFDAVSRTGRYDLMIVDLGLPDGDGSDAIRNYRKAGGTAPIIIITARNKVNDLVQGLDCGADDFLCKPVHFDVLMARLRALQRRPRQLADRKRCVGKLTLDQVSGEIKFEDGDVPLSPAERRLLGLLMRRAGSVVSKTQIDGQVHGLDRQNSPNAVEQLVSRLRKSLARTRSGVDVKTIRGIGYVLEERPS